jgi:hypothetical protein
MKVIIPQLLLTFNDGGIFVGLYNHMSHYTSIEPFPEGTPVTFPLKSPHYHHQTIQMRGTVISVPRPNNNTQLPHSDANASPYEIRLVYGSIHKISPDFLESIMSLKTSVPNKISFPIWLGNPQKVIFLHDGTYVKDVMEWALDNFTWHFSQCCGNGTEIFGITLPIFFNLFKHILMMAPLFQDRMGGSELSPCWSLSSRLSYNIKVPHSSWFCHESIVSPES